MPEKKSLRNRKAACASGMRDHSASYSRPRRKRILTCWKAVRNSCRYQMFMPPEASMGWPLTRRLSSESNDATIGPVSSGWPESNTLEA
jgi:hypothetical protein